MKEDEVVKIKKKDLDRIIREKTELKKLVAEYENRLQSLELGIIDYDNLGEHDYIGASITGLQKEAVIVRRRTSQLPKGVGEAFGMAEEALMRLLPFTASLLKALYASADWTAAEQGKALSEMMATMSKRYTKRYPSEKVYEEVEEVEEE